MGEMIVIWIVVLLVFLPCLLSFLQHTNTDEPRDMDRDISDEEFLKACSVKDPNIALKVRKILSDCSGVPDESIHPDDRIIQDLGMY